MRHLGSARPACVLLFALAVLPGCRTLHADPEQYTKKDALNALRGYYPVIQEVNDRYISVPDWIGGSTVPVVILYEEIAYVRVYPQVKWMFLWFFTAGICGPMWHNLEVVLNTGVSVPIIFNCRWGWNFIPFWLYPNILIHGYGPGFALDWLRQNAQSGGSTEPAPKK
jgi:hypothetical protein